MQYGYKIDGLRSEVIRYDSASEVTVHGQRLSPGTISLYIECTKSKGISLEALVVEYGKQMFEAVRSLGMRFSRIEITVYLTRSKIDKLFENFMFDVGMELTSRPNFFGHDVHALVYSMTTHVTDSSSAE